ncbi:MAG: FGGY family carbohydrate kinase, partial [Deinococcus sp.]
LEVVARAGRSYGLHSGPDGEAVQNPEEVVGAALAALAELAEGLGGRTVQAIVPSAAMHSLIPLDRAGAPLAPALTWADTRPASVLPELRALLDPGALYARTGCPLQAPYHPARLLWLCRTQPEVFYRAERFVSLTDLLLFHLTGRWATSVGLASTSGLWTLDGGWDEGGLAALCVRPEQLPPVFDAREVIGPVLAGELAGTPVLAGSSDGALANLGSGAGGGVVVTVGTSGALRRLAPAPRLDPGARSWSYRLDSSTFLNGGAINNGGLLLEWARRQWYPELDSAQGFRQLLDDAGQTPAGADGLTMLPYLTGERSPLWRSDLTASLHGLRLHHGRPQLARAALEAIAFSLAAVWDAVRETDTPDREILASGGLAASPAWTRLLAGVLELPIRPLDAADASASGAALLGFGEEAVRRLEERVGALPAMPPDPSQLGALREARARWTSVQRQLYGES